MAKCPVCGRTIGNWSDDPLFIKPSLSIKQYEGFSQPCYKHIEELQNDRIAKEIEVLTPENYTKFSPVNLSGKFQITQQHIIELRESTLKILEATGQTFEEYLNYDEDGEDMHPGNHRLDWIDSNILNNKILIKGIHIEDLRKYFRMDLWKETWKNTRINEEDVISKTEDSLELDTDWNPPNVSFNQAHLYADNKWVAQVGTNWFVSLLGTGNTKGNASALWKATDTYFNFQGQIQNLQNQQNLNSYGVIGNSALLVNRGELFAYTYDKSTQLTIDSYLTLDWSSSINYSFGIDHILDPAWEEFYEDRKAATIMGGASFVRIYYNIGYEQFTTFTRTQGQNTLDLGYMSEYNGGIYLYDAVCNTYGYISPEEFETWFISAIVIGVYGYTRDVSVQEEITVKAYSTDASLSINVMLGNMRIINKPR